MHKRAKDATHVPNAWDSSVAGLVQVKDGKVNFQKALHEDLKREMSMTEEEIKASQIRVTGVHSSRAPDFSGTIDFVIHTTLTRKAIEDKLEGKKWFEEYAIISQKEIPDFILSNYTGNKEICPEGCAVLLLSLPPQEYRRTLKSLRKKGIFIEPGRLNKDRFFKL